MHCAIFISIKVWLGGWKGIGLRGRGGQGTYDCYTPCVRSCGGGAFIGYAGDDENEG